MFLCAVYAMVGIIGACPPVEKIIGVECASLRDAQVYAVDPEIRAVTRCGETTQVEASPSYTHGLWHINAIKRVSVEGQGFLLYFLINEYNAMEVVLVPQTQV